MSTDDRLARLGLLHLKDKPEELAKALNEGVEQYDEEVRVWHADLERLRVEREAQGAKLKALSLEAIMRRFHELEQSG